MKFVGMEYLKKNQIDAVNISINNNFESGIHFHATGTGKSWIAMNIIYEYNNKYQNNNILWLCESKSILIEQFNIDLLKERNLDYIVDKFSIYNYAKTKVNNWWNIIPNEKPILLIINRAYLTSKKVYEKINFNNGRA